MSSPYDFKPGGLKLKGLDSKSKKKKKAKSSTSSSSSKHASTGISSSTSLTKEKSRSISRDHPPAEEQDDDDEERAGERGEEKAHNSGSGSKEAQGGYEDTRTEAERRFEEIRLRRMAERVAKEAKRSHKDKVDAFNEHLSSLSEHHDIPKVGPG